MSTAFEQAFWLAVDEINSGSIEPPERYLKMVPTSERDELAQLLAAVLASRGPVMADEVDAEGYSRALAAIDEVAGAASPSGMLPAALKRMRKARGIEREHVLDALADEFGITSPAARKALQRSYHQLESGQLLGSRLAHRLLRSLAHAFDAEPEDFIAGARPTGPVARPRAASAMGRGSTEKPTPTQPAVRGQRRQHAVKPDADLELVERLFTGGPDA
jgi:transcriptional regulator with XRE-family HTH domain